jgi:hypothetical protein
MKITKIDAARRQLCTAIHLFFNGGDEVAIHTLTAAAFAVTRDLCDAEKDKSDSATKMIEDAVKPEHHAQIWKKVHESANFFKHADRDSTEFHEFNAEQTQVLMFFSVHQYQALTGEKISQMMAFLLWFMLDFPQGFKLSPEVITLTRNLDHSDRLRFYNGALAACNLAGI